MPFVLLTPLVVVAVIVALAMGVPARRALTWAAAAVGGLIVLTAVSIVGIVAVERDDEPVGGERAPSPVPVRPVDVELRSPPDEPFPEPEEPIDGLADGDTVLVRVALERPVTVHQCPADEPSPRRCTRGIPAGTEGREHAVVLVQLHETYQAGGRNVDCLVRACILAAFSDDGQSEAARPIVFGPSQPRPRLDAPGAPVEPGQLVTVRLHSLPSGATGAVTLCVPGTRGGPPACGAPAPEVAFRADGDGTASAELPVEPGPVANGAGRCERRSPCAIGVIGAPVATPFAPVRFAAPRGADVPVQRAGIALALALLLTAAAVVLVRCTDWSPPGGDPFAGVSLRGDPFEGIDLDDDRDW